MSTIEQAENPLVEGLERLPVAPTTLVLFGATGDLAHKMIFPALYALAKAGALDVPVIGVAAPDWSVAQLRERVSDSIAAAGGAGDADALRRLMNQLGYVGGDYKDAATFAKLKQALGDAGADEERDVAPQRADLLD